MAKKSSIEKNNRRIRRVKQYAKRWDRLRDVARDKTAPAEERFEAQLKMAELPRRFKLSRIALRDLASVGLIPGVTKSSW